MNNTHDGFENELEKSGFSIGSLRKPLMLGGAATAAVGLFSAMPSLVSYNKTTGELLGKFPAVLNTPLGKFYNPKQDVARAEEIIGKKIAVADLSQMSDEEAKKKTGMGVMALRGVLQDNAMAISLKPEDIGTEELGKELVDPTIIVPPSVSRAIVLHELGHLIDAAKRTGEGKRISRIISNRFGEWKKDPGYIKGRLPAVLDEIKAWDYAKQLAPKYTKEIDRAREVSLQSYEVAEKLNNDMNIPLGLTVAGTALSAIGSLLKKKPPKFRLRSVSKFDQFREALDRII